jgi:hypothetical protein
LEWAWVEYITCNDHKTPPATRAANKSGPPDFEREASAYLAKTTFPDELIAFDHHFVAACMVWWLRYTAGTAVTFIHSRPTPPR